MLYKLLSKNCIEFEISTRMKHNKIQHRDIEIL